LSPASNSGQSALGLNCAERNPPDA
jgi:hypothetical protein